VTLVRFKTRNDAVEEIKYPDTPTIYKIQTAREIRNWTERDPNRMCYDHTICQNLINETSDHKTE
jgi:hypothetical protein